MALGRRLRRTPPNSRAALSFAQAVKKPLSFSNNYQNYNRQSQTPFLTKTFSEFTYDGTPFPFKFKDNSLHIKATNWNAFVQQQKELEGVRTLGNTTTRKLGKRAQRRRRREITYYQSLFHNLTAKQLKQQQIQQRKQQDSKENDIHITTEEKQQNIKEKKIIIRHTKQKQKQKKK